MLDSLLRKECLLELMKVGGKRVKTGKLPLLQVLLAGILAGGILINYKKGWLLENTGFIDEQMLYHMKYMTVDNNTLFCYILSLRLKSVGILAVMSTTYLGLAVIVGMVLWYGISMGMFLAAVVLRYGIKGVLLAVIGVFPQYLLYVPAIIFLIGWGETVCRSIYFDKIGEEGIRRQLPRRLIQLGIVILVVVIGSALESYVNPFLVTKLLKIF